jgi:deazaflavin-dependent oxidoreductase (nitroreductase family)
MKLVTKIMMGLWVFLYRLTGGKVGGSLGTFKVLILTTRGRKSGRILSNPVGYFERDSGYVIVASNSGRAKNPAWYYNLKANPQDVIIQINQKKMKARPEMISGDSRKQVWNWIVSQAPNFGDYEKRTTREIPLVFLKP